MNASADKRSDKGSGITRTSERPKAISRERRPMSEGSGVVNPPIVIVGAGLAGLTCARMLEDAGRRVLVLEASDGVGGRVRTDRHADGFVIDRGFQVVLDAYPALRRHVDLSALGLRAFDAAALIWTGRRLRLLADPIRHRSAIMEDLRSSVILTGDKLRLAKFAAQCRFASWENANAAAGDWDDSAIAALHAAGFSRRFIDRFARPFWGGTLLDPSLRGSQGPLKFALKMFLQGSAMLPAAGVQQIPAQIASRLPNGCIRLRERVDDIQMQHGCACGVIANGRIVAARAFVIATDPITAKRLTRIDAIPTAAVGCTTVFLRSRRDPGIGRRLVLNGAGAGEVNHIAPLSAVAPSYAPAGAHLVAAVLLGEGALNEADDEKIGRRAIEEVARTLGHGSGDWSALAVRRVPFSQFAQPPGIYRSLPRATT
ncbi:MAG: NAD(P)/FAD-dependent oxidoreductase, partial [Opitutaceae bacterium]